LSVTSTPSKPSSPADKTESVREKPDEHRRTIPPLIDFVDKTKSVERNRDEPQKTNGMNAQEEGTNMAKQTIHSEGRMSEQEPLFLGPAEQCSQQKRKESHSLLEAVNGESDALNTGTSVTGQPIPTVENTETDLLPTTDKEPKNLNLTVLLIDQANLSKKREAVTNLPVNHEDEPADLDPLKNLNKKMQMFDAQYATPTATQSDLPVATVEQDEATDTIVVNLKKISPQKRRFKNQAPSERKPKIPRPNYVVPEALMTDYHPTIKSTSSLHSDTLIKLDSPTGTSKSDEESVWVADALSESGSVNRLVGMVGSVSNLINKTKNEALRDELQSILSYTERHLTVDVEASLRKYAVPIRKGKKQGI
jgi:hypothetical protein